MYWITAFLGIVLIGAPFALSYSDAPAAMWTSVAIGFTLTSASLLEWAAEGQQKWEYWVLGLSGLAAVIAPFILGFGLSTLSTWIMLVTGLITVGVSTDKLLRGNTHY